MRVAISGCGTMGSMHAGLARQCGLEVTACFDPIRARAAALAKQHNANAARSFDALLGVADLIVIASPTPLHAEQVIATAKAGKHVFCEKPFARTLAAAKRAAAAVNQSGITCFVGHVVRYFHEFEAIEAQIALGKIGKIGWVKTFRGGRCPSGAKNWFRDYSQSGGAAFDMLIHDFDWICHMFGAPRRVFCQALRRSKPAPMDYALVTLTFESGLIAQCIGSWAHPAGFRVKVELCGESGMIQYDSAGAPINALSRGPDRTQNPIIPSSPVGTSPYRKEWDDLLRWLREGTPPRVSVDDAVAAVQIAEAALKSTDSGRPVGIGG